VWDSASVIRKSEIKETSLTTESPGKEHSTQFIECPVGGRFQAAPWLKSKATDFLQWTADSGVVASNSATMSEAISIAVHPSFFWVEEMRSLASCLPKVLNSCDGLRFSSLSEATAYAGLHLLDRYGRVAQALEYLMRVGRLPIRKRAVKVLEVGAGPAPALYAVRDFYSMLRAWPGRGEVQIADVELAHSIERGEAWDSILHHISEQLMLARTDASPKALPFSRTIPDFTDFSALAQRRQEFERKAQHIHWEFMHAEDPISMLTARRISLKEGNASPHAYDLIFMCNFLTQPSMTKNFDKELRQLAQDLTPGGILAILGGTGKQYPSVYAEVRRIASEQRLTDISPTESFDANREPHRGVVCRQVRDYVHAVLAKCSEDERNTLTTELPQDAWSDKVDFKLPSFQVLAFSNQRRPKSMRQKGNKKKVF
jgi:ribosomal protein RSM22 (predicted rRNA methylase)